jgi:hypothetical protein
MWTAASVLVCALAVLGRSERSMPPIELIEIAPPDVSVGAEAFVRHETKTIYLITTSPVFRGAAEAGRDRCETSLEIKKLASILAHEEWHIRHGRDEESAYQWQLITLLRLGVPTSSALYLNVQKSMLTVLRHQKRNRPERLLAREN